jgi:ribosomal-protein-alanine N-acetyltransferase
MESQRCLLRPLVEEDSDWLTDLIADREINRYLLGEKVESLEKARKAADAMIYLDLMRGAFGEWAIQDKQSGVIHGYAGLGKLRPWSGRSDEIAISYVLRRSSWGQGLASEVAGRLVLYGFEAQRLERIMAVVLARNDASKRVLEKIGMKFVKRLDLHHGERLEYYRIDAPKQ